MLIVFGLGTLLGFAWAQTLVSISDGYRILLVITLIVMLFIILKRFITGIYHRAIVGLLIALLGFITASSYTLYQGQKRLNHQLAIQHSNKVSRVVLRVHDIATYRENSIQFNAEVIDTPHIAVNDIPQSIRVTWNLNPSFQLYQSVLVESQPIVRPGQIWEMALLLKTPNTLLNIGGFDSETHLFKEEVRALGVVKGSPKLLKEQEHTWHTWLQSIRHDIRETMQAYVGNKRYGAVLIALVMGDQQGIAQADWALFNRTGMTHLVSISGSHITMLSGLSTLIVIFLLKRIRVKGKVWGDKVRLSTLAYLAGLGVAFFYCLLAGWGVPAQRTFVMLLLVYVFTVFQYKVSLSSIFLIAAMIILYLDPWSILSTGFYLSFGAVAVLHQLLSRFRIEQKKGLKGWRLYQQMLKQWFILQGAITIALAPFLLYFFHQLSLISPIVNAYAIIGVGLVVTPLALILGILSYLFSTEYIEWLQVLADITHFLLAQIMKLSEILASFPWASIRVTSLPIWVLMLCGLGIFLLLLPKGIPYRYSAMVLLVPAFFFVDKPLQAGEWRLRAFDIGQGGAVLVQTQGHVLLFDTGLRASPYYESGERVLLPAFHALGIQQLDAVVISHSDIDHSGGLASIIQNIPVQHIYASFAVDRFLDREESLLGRAVESKNPYLRYQACHQGVTFYYDEVRFQFLNIKQSSLPFKSSNAQSCVLWIKGKHHQALLTGDILVAQEQTLLDYWQKQQEVESVAALNRNGEVVKIDLVQVPHHGSLSSSSSPWVEWLNASYVFAQSAYQNRFKHPHPEVRARWEKTGSQFFNTAETGELSFYSSYRGLQLTKRREDKRRYWHR